MHYAFCATVYGGSRVVGVHAVAASLSKHDIHALVVNIMVDSPCGIASAAHACHKIIGIVAPYLLLQLPFYLF